MEEKERILEVVHVGEFPAYEIVEVGRGGDIRLRFVQDPEESITIARRAIPRLIDALAKLKI